jgi:hypothetical protein
MKDDNPSVRDILLHAMALSRTAPYQGFIILDGFSPKRYKLLTLLQNVKIL